MQAHPASEPVLGGLPGLPGGAGQERRRSSGSNRRVSGKGRSSGRGEAPDPAAASIFPVRRQQIRRPGGRGGMGRGPRWRRKRPEHSESRVASTTGGVLDGIAGGISSRLARQRWPQPATAAVRARPHQAARDPAGRGGGHGEWRHRGHQVHAPGTAPRTDFACWYNRSL